MENGNEDRDAESTSAIQNLPDGGTMDNYDRVYQPTAVTPTPQVDGAIYN